MRHGIGPPAVSFATEMSPGATAPPAEGGVQPVAAHQVGARIGQVLQELLIQVLGEQQGALLRARGAEVKPFA
jgi:hypothetical protein